MRQVDGVAHPRPDRLCPPASPRIRSGAGIFSGMTARNAKSTAAATSTDDTTKSDDAATSQNDDTTTDAPEASVKITPEDVSRFTRDQLVKLREQVAPAATVAAAAYHDLYDLLSIIDGDLATRPADVTEGH